MALIAGLGPLELVLAAVLILVGTYLLLRLFHHFYKAFIVGVLFTAIPFGANAFGFSMATDAAALVTFMFIGVSVYLSLHTIYIGMKVSKVVFSPLNRFFKEKDVRRQKHEKLPRK